MHHTLRYSLFLVLVAAFAAGCGGDDTSTEIIPTASVTLQLSNTGTANVYTQVGYGGTDWLSILDAAGEPLTLNQGCGCTCDEYPDCPVCAADAIQPTAVPLAAGESKTQTWDGIVYVPRAVDQGFCLEKTLMPDGPYDARFCWGKGSKETEFGSTAATGFSCDVVRFQLGTDETVTHEVFAEPATDGLDIVIENAGVTSMYIQSIGNTCDSTPGWFSVSHAGGAVNLIAPCGMCDCSAGTSCSTQGCDAACQAPQIMELTSGLTETFVWDGVSHVLGTGIDGNQCADQEAIPAGPVDVEICYGFTVTGDLMFDGTITDLTCETVTVQLGTDTEARVSAGLMPVP